MGVDTTLTSQKCSFHLNDQGSEERFGMRILHATLDTNACGGHTFDTFLSQQLGESVHGSKAYRELDEASGGSSTSVSSHGHTVVECAGAQRTMVRRAVVVLHGLASEL